MARTQTMVQLRDDLIELLDEEAAHRGISRSALIREALEEHLAAAARSAVGRQIVAGYERIPQSEPDAWGDPDGFSDVGGKELLQRLDHEEAEAGFQPW